MRANGDPPHTYEQMSDGDQSGSVRAVRTSGVIDRVRGFGLHDHVFWAYEDPENLRVGVRDFLAEGLAQGQRVCYVASGDPETLAEDLAGIAGLAEALTRGAAQIVPLDATYSMGTLIEPASQVHTYAAATQQALAVGFTGLRVAAEATPLVRGPRQLAAFARYEHLVDQYMTTSPFSAMCAYDSTELGDDRLAQLACLHPNTNCSVPGFRLHASADVAAALGGELDPKTVSLFGLALERADLRATDGELVIDAVTVTFMDHRNLTLLAEQAQQANATLVLRTAWPGLQRLVEVLGMEGVRVEPLA